MVVAIGMDDPQGQDSTVMHRADEVLFDESVDLFQCLVNGKRRGISVFIRSHRLHDEGNMGFCQTEIRYVFSSRYINTYFR